MSKEKFSSYGEDTDLYSAISEGIRLLKKEDTDYKVVVVVTAGKNINVSGASVEMETIRREAEEAGIQVYAVRFPVYGPTPVLDVLIEGSLGYTITYNTFEQTANDLKTLYDNLDERCYGHDYEFSFETSAKKDGNTHSISFFVNKISKGPLNFNAPGSPVASGKTFVIWIKDNLILFILIVVGFVAIVIVVALLIRRKIQKHNREIAENEMMLEGKISDSNKIIEEMKNKAARDEMDRKASEERKRKEEAVAKLANIMQVKNLYPRLQCNVEGNMFSYSISKPSTKIGRNSDNDIVLPHKTVSGYHAEILFDGASFVLNNRSQTYTQGVVVNGQFFQQCTLKNGDVIGFGVATVSFYL